MIDGQEIQSDRVIGTSRQDDPEGQFKVTYYEVWGRGFQLTPSAFIQKKVPQKAGISFHGFEIGAIPDG